MNRASRRKRIIPPAPSPESVVFGQLLEMEEGEGHRLVLGFDTTGQPYVRCTSGPDCSYAKRLEMEVLKAWSVWSTSSKGRASTDPPAEFLTAVRRASGLSWEAR
jgi:hypothetical protein